jgi:hypothetical protein
MCQEVLNPALVQGAGDQPRQGRLGIGNLEGSAKTLGESRKASRGQGLDALLQGWWAT